MTSLELEFLTQGLNSETRERVIAAWHRLGDAAEKTFPATLAVALFSAARAQALNTAEAISALEEGPRAIRQAAEALKISVADHSKKVIETRELTETLVHHAERLRNTNAINVAILIGIAALLGFAVGAIFF